MTKDVVCFRDYTVAAPGAPETARVLGRVKVPNYAAPGFVTWFRVRLANGKRVLMHAEHLRGMP